VIPSSSRRSSTHGIPIFFTPSDADVWFEPARPDTPIAYTYCPAALVVSAALTCLPMKSTDRGISRSTRNGGRDLTDLSDQGEPVLQRFRVAFVS